MLSAGTLGLFLPTLLSYHDLWRAQPYTHGYLIAAATTWLVWRGRRLFARADIGWLSPLPIAAALSVLWAIAAVADVRVVMQAALPALMLCWSAVVFGPAAARRLAPIAGVFLLAVPFWGVFVRPLQVMTVAVSKLVLGLVGVPVVIEGAVIHIPSGTFLIEDACAGFNYFMAGLAVGAIYAMAFLRHWPARMTFIAIAATMAIVGNWIRVTSLIVIGHVTSMEADLIYDHGTYGWVIFSVGLVLLLPAADLVAKWEATRWPAGGGDPHPSRGASPQIEDTTEPEGAILERRGPEAGTLRPALLASMVAIMGPVLHLSIGALPPREVDPPSLTPPTTWHAAETVDPGPDAWSPAYPGADVQEVQRWTNGDGLVRVDRLAYRSQEQGAELIGYLSRIAPDSLLAAERLFGPVGPDRRIVNEAIVREGRDHRLVWYWYTVGGVETASPLKAKLLEVSAFLRRLRYSELIALSAPCGVEDCTEAARLLLGFLEAN